MVPRHTELATAKRWLNKCCDFHDCKARQEVELPTRLLELGGPDSHIIRLVTPPRGTVGKYMALSYCWGRSVQFTATRDNVEELARGFHLAFLPATIRDAVLVTGGLGLRYLWVDALCIIQGSDDTARRDWAIESARMAEVYSNAFCTVVAASAAGSNEGIFFYRPAQYSSSLRPHILNTTIDVSKENQAGGSLTAHGRNARDHTLRNCVSIMSLLRGFADEPINRRAWALQERLLSPRLLIYTWDHIFWHCDENLDASNGPDGVEWSHSMYKYRLRGDTVTQWDWEQIVENYCSRSLTYSQDKLPALSGLARRYQAANSKPDKYLAGLWESHLPQHLLWVQFGDWYRAFVANAENQRPSEYRAPSWSWASIDGLVSYIHVRDIKYPSLYTLEVVSSHIELENDNSPFGRIKGGSLILCGRFKQAFMVMVSDVPQIFATENKEFNIGSVFLDDESLQGRKLADRHPIFCLLVVTGIYYRSLVLTDVVGRAGVYSRMGTCASSDQDQKLWFQNAPVETVTII
jgi:hypothetical protein